MKTALTVFQLLLVASRCQGNYLRFLDMNENDDVDEEIAEAFARYSEEDGPVPVLPSDYREGVFPPPGTPSDLPESNKVFLQLETDEDQGIVGGNSIYTAPEWFVFPSLDKDKNCGGSLVSPDTVVTAAHCYDECDNIFFDCDEPCPRQVRIGSAYRQKGGVLRDVLPYSCKMHPNFIRNPNRYDIAVYKLTEPVILEKYATIQANPNFPGFDDSGENNRFYEFVAFGYGRFSNNQKSGAEVLRQAKLTYWDNCTAYEGGNLYEPAHHVCAYSTNDEGICLGDSGGPLVFFDKEKNIDYLTGIMSFLGRSEEPFCAQGVVDYFTRVGTYSNWVTQQSNSTTQEQTCGGSLGEKASTWFYDRIQSVGSSFSMFFQGWS